MGYNLWGNPIIEEPIEVNIYADEAMEMPIFWT